MTFMGHLVNIFYNIMYLIVLHRRNLR